MQNIIDDLQREVVMLREMNAMLRRQVDSLRNSITIKYNMSDDYKDKMTLDLILEEACQVMNVAINDATSTSRKYELVTARALYMTYSHRSNLATLAEIGRRVNRDHSTVIHTINLVNRDILFERRYRSFENTINKVYAHVH